MAGERWGNTSSAVLLIVCFKPLCLARAVRPCLCDRTHDDFNPCVLCSQLLNSAGPGTAQVQRDNSSAPVGAANLLVNRGPRLPVRRWRRSVRHASPPDGIDGSSRLSQSSDDPEANTCQRSRFTATLRYATRRTGSGKSPGRARRRGPVPSMPVDDILNRGIEFRNLLPFGGANRRFDTLR